MRKLAPLLALTCLFSNFPLWANSDSPIIHYITQYKDIAINEMKRTGIPASITLAQAIVESKYGTSSLALESNNHFGIKCKSNWEGRSFYFKDDDYQNGQLVPSCFRSYDDPVQSYFDHSDFLLNNQRYLPLFQLHPTDYKGWAIGLKKCGYATAPHYASSLIATIERYQLQKYDQSISLIQAAYSLTAPVQRVEISTTAAALVPPKSIKLPLHYRIGQGTSMAITSTSYKRRGTQTRAPYVVHIVPNVSRKEVELGNR